MGQYGNAQAHPLYAANIFGARASRWAEYALETAPLLAAAGLSVGTLVAGAGVFVITGEVIVPPRIGVDQARRRV
jgi:hypothetical protein